MRLWPALDIRPTAPAGDREELQGLILAALDDRGVSAIEELSFGWRIFFASEERRGAAARLLQDWGDGLLVSSIDVPDEDWARRSQEGLAPVRVGRVRIVPPWAAEPSREDESIPQPPGAAIDIVIQPSMGFGTGHHATTRLCVALLQKTDVVGRRVLDVGTGSGVLAIVASRLGADFVLGIDDDPDALESARENLHLNHVTSGVVLQRSDFRELAAGAFDLVSANLTGGLLVRGASKLVAAVRPGGTLILSGITLDEESSVRGFYDSDLSLASRLDEDGWVALLFRRTPRA
jgi:ribosomal protein L11 methyltransferase